MSLAPRPAGGQGGAGGGGGGLVQGEGDQFAQLQDVGLQGGADAARGRPDHSSSTRAATGTTRSACRASSARTWRGLGAVGAIDTPFSLTSNVPSTSICTPSPPRWVCAVLRYPEYKTGRTVCQYQTVHAVLMHRAAGHPRPRPPPGLRIRSFPGRPAGKGGAGIPAGAGRGGVRRGGRAAAAGALDAVNRPIVLFMGGGGGRAGKDTGLTAGVAVFAGGQVGVLAVEHRQRADEDLAGGGGVDDVVDQAALGRVVGVHQLRPVLLDQLLPHRLRVGGLGDTAAEDDARGALRAHHRDLVGGPGVGEVGADGLAVHHDVGAAVGLRRMSEMRGTVALQ